MEAHFLSEVVAGPPTFQDRPWYNPHGDCIVHQVADEAIIADRIDELLTLYRSAIDRRVIGYQIKGVMTLIRKFGWDGLTVHCVTGKARDEVQQVSIAALLLAAYEVGPPTISRRVGYAQGLQTKADAVIPAAELCGAADQQ